MFLHRSKTIKPLHEALPKLGQAAQWHWVLPPLVQRILSWKVPNCQYAKTKTAWWSAVTDFRSLIQGSWAFRAHIFIVLHMLKLRFSITLAIAALHFCTSCPWIQSEKHHTIRYLPVEKISSTTQDLYRSGKSCSLSDFCYIYSTSPKKVNAVVLPLNSRHTNYVFSTCNCVTSSY